MNVLQNNRNIFSPELSGRGEIAKANGTDRSNDKIINNAINGPTYGPIYCPINSAKRKRLYREDNEARIGANPEIR